MDDLFIGFANTEQFDGRGNREDHLLDAAALHAFLRRWDLPHPDPIDDDLVHELVAFRSVIRSIVERRAAGRRPAAGDLARLNEALDAHPVRFRLRVRSGRSMLGVEPIAASDPSAIVGAIALSAARFLAEQEDDRLKTCENAGCRWVFFDATKNRNRRWCATCGNADRVRRFRERRRRERAAHGS